MKLIVAIVHDQEPAKPVDSLYRLEALRREDVAFVLTHHEATAGFLAASWGELSGQPGVCLSTLGPGASNLLSGVAHAFLDRCPVIAITAQLATDREIRATHQRL